MSKKILFMSSAKLTAICFGLLLAVFCTIGMSFTPGEEGENLGNPNDSTYVTGPRRSHWHWTTGTCTTTHHYKSSVDYAETKVQTRGNGSATISTTETANVTSATSASTTTTAGNTASISWNSGLSHDDKTSAQYTNDQIIAAHKKVFTLTAEPINADYYFLGWGTSTSESSIVSADNPYTVTSNMGITGYTDASSQPANYATNTYTETYYAFFKERLPANITLKLPTNGTVKYSYESYSNVTLSAETTITTKYDLALVATPDVGYVFFGWYTMDGSTEDFISTSESYTRAYPNDITIYAKFIPSNQAIFNVKGTEQYYYDLGRACSEAASSSSKIVYPIADGTVPAGNYTIPSGVTLLVPYNSANNTQTKPALVTAESPLTIYRKLTLLDGANITVNGNICVGGQQTCMAGGKPSGYVTGACGVIDMSLGGHIELNNGSCFYAWGFVKGQDMDQGNNTVGVGTITANNGAKVYENFAVGDWRGGSACLDIRGSNFFPFQSYFIQNIEVPLTVQYGATDNCYASVSGGGQNLQLPATMIGTTDALFKLASGGVVRKWYDATTDLMCFELSGTANLDAVVVKGLPVVGNISSSDYYLPISSNMHIILTNSSVTISKPMTVQPGAKIEVKSDANITISSNVFLYDKEEWGAYAGPSYYFHNYGNTYGILTSHKNRGDGFSKDLLDDAQIIVDGQLNVTGKLYSTASGADVMGNGGGHVVFSALPSSSTTIDAFTGNGTAVSGGVTVNTANLCNEDESYTKSIASTTFYNVHGRWFKSGNQNEKANHTYNFTYIRSGAVSGTGGTSSTTDALYAPDKTGLVAGMKWCNVVQDATCTNIFNATQALNETPASDIRYTYPSDSWLQLLKTETEGVYGGSDNSLYAVDGCAVNSLGSVDENCLYTIGGVKKALVDGHFVALEKNTEDEAWHDVANPTNYYICFEGCNWHPATKYPDEEKAYIVEDGNYIWYNNDWLLVEREEPFFFDYNDQNVKRYYEYEDGAWVLASPRVRVVDAIETRDFYKLPEAITVASGKKNTTITILKDISGINTRMTYTAKNTTCTLDLNGHTVSGAAPFGDDNNRGLLIINASGTTFTITDNSTNKEGRLENICNQNKVTYTVHLMAGTLNVEHGTIHAENPAQYAAKANATTGITEALTACGARGIQVNAAQKLNVTGGRIEAYATRNAYGIVAAGNAANTTLVTVSGGTIYAEAPYGAYGINCSGKLHVSGGTITGHLNTAWVDGQYTQGSNSDRNCHQYAYGINMTASSNATASSCYYGTLTMTGGTVQATSAWDASYTCYAYGVRIQKALTAVADASKTADGTHSQKASAIGSITGGTISVDIKGNYAYGVFVEGNYNSYNKTSNTFHISGATITSKAKNYAYGVYANASIDGTCGGYHYGIVEQDNNTVTAQTTAAYAYAVYVVSTSTTIFQDKQANYYGEYATAAEMTIKSGNYTASAGSSIAYAAASSTRSKSTYGSTTSVETNRTLGGNAEAYAKLIINGGTFNATTKTTTARGVSSGGNTTIKDATFNVVAGTTTAYGLYAISGKLTATNVIINSTANGRTSSSNNNAYAYGVLVDCSIPNGNTAQTGFAYAGDVELNNCTINAVTTTYDNARALYVNATNKVYNWTTFKADSLKGNGSGTPWSTATYNAYKSVFPCTLQGRDSVSYAIAGKATVNGGTFTAKAGRASAYGAVSTQTSVPANKEVTASPEMTLKNATFSAQTGTSTTAYGVQAGGPTLIEGCTITATAGNSTKYQSTASGVRALDKTTIIKNSTITATATDAAYGLEGYVEINATHGYCWHGEFDLSEAGTTEVTAEAKTSGKKAWSVYLQATNKNIASGDFAGDYATAANATINGGTYKAIASGSGASAYCLSIAGKKTQGEVSAQPEVEVLDGFFNGATAEVGTAGVVGHMQLNGGYFVHPTNLSTYAVAPKSVWTLPNTHEHYNPYYYKIAEIYTLAWVTDGDALTGTYTNGITEVGTAITAPNTPTKTGHTFASWSPDAAATMPVGNTTYTATWTVNKHNLIWDANGGELSGDYTSGLVNYGTAIVAPTAIRENYVFNGWSTDVTTMPDEDLAITAQWIPAVASVTANNETTYHATIASAITDANGKTGATVMMLDNTSTTEVTISAAMTIDLNGKTITSTETTEKKAVFKIATGSKSTTVTITDGASGGKIDHTANVSGYVYGINLTKGTLNVTGGTIYAKNNVGSNNSGYRTYAIYTPSGSSSNCAITISNGTIEAHSPNTQRPLGICAYCNLTMTGGTVIADGYTLVRGIWVQNTTTSLTDVTITATATNGYSYAVVNKAGTMTINSGTYTATGTTDTYAILENAGTVNINGGKFSGSTKEFNQETGTASLKGGYYAHNTDLAANCATNYHVFPASLTEGGITYYNKVAEAYTVTFMNGSVQLQSDYVETGVKPVYAGTPTKAADAQYSYTFDGWTTNAEGTGTVYTASTLPIVATAAATYFAHYSKTENKYTVTVSAAAHGSVSPAAVSNIGCETASGDITATPNAGYNFSSWTLPEGVTAATGYDANSNPIRIHATAADKTITANFVAVTVNYTVKHWQQNIEDDNYTEVEADRQILQGTTATATAAEARSYTSFTAQTIEQGTIAGNGTTVVNIYYNRNTYTITWKDGSETIKTEPWKYGATPAFAYQKPATAQYTYELIGWSNGTNIYDFPATLPEVTDEATYTARYSSNIRSYLIKFVNDDNTTVLQSSNVQWGGQPNYEGKTPTSTKTDGIYQFTSWSSDIVAVTGPATYTAQYTKLMDLVVEEGDTLNVGTTAEVTTTTVHVAGIVNVESGKTLTTDDLILEATPTTSGEITGAGTVNVTTNAYFHFSQTGGFKAKTWYAVAVPWQVNVPANALGDVYIKKGDGSFVQQTLGKTFDLIYYDGYRRSQGATKAWNYVEDDDASEQVMYPGRAYMIYLTADADTIRFKKDSETLLYTNVNVARYASDNGNLADWNGIANPAIYKAYLNVGATDNKAQVYNPDTKQYELFDMSANQLQVGQPIFVQSTVEGTIVANAESNAYTPVLAPRRAKVEESMTRYELYLAPSMDVATDRIIVRMSEDKETDEYIVGQDLAKMGVSSLVPQMWVDRYDSKMCINTAIPTDDQAYYPLGISVPQNGEYDIFLDDEPDSESTLYLTYDGEVIWNLSYGFYVAHLEKGTNTHYGLRIVKTPKVATGIDNAETSGKDINVYKIIVDDKVFIIRGNQVYGIDGRLAK